MTTINTNVNALINYTFPEAVENLQNGKRAFRKSWFNVFIGGFSCIDNRSLDYFSINYESALNNDDLILKRFICLLQNDDAKSAVLNSYSSKFLGRIFNFSSDPYFVYFQIVKVEVANISTTNCRIKPGWTPTMEDILADDWVVV